MRNTLYFGDNLDVLREHVPTDSVDLIYLDPPFNSNRNYFVLFKDRTGKASAAQEEAFVDTWTWTETSERTYRELMCECPSAQLSTVIGAIRAVLRETPMMAYLVSMAIRIVEMHRSLKPTGSLYLHCDPTASHYLKIVLDVIFGPENFRSDIIWKRHSAHNNAKHAYPAVADTILFYSKSGQFTFNMQRSAYSPEYIKSFFRYTDEKGRRYRVNSLKNPSPRPNLAYEYKGYPPPPTGWTCNLEKMEEYDRVGRLEFPKNPNGRIGLRYFLEDMTGVPVPNVWDDIQALSGAHSERLGYPTQKPLALLERIVSTSSNPGDLVLDPFCGCGTTVTAAHKLGRAWIGIDITTVAITVIKSRMQSSFDDIGDIPVIGLPKDLEGARTLFETSPHDFQQWACAYINSYPLTKKGADSGIDGWLRFLDYDETHHACPVQVKGGKVQVGHVRDFCHVIDREKAPIGFFLCMGDVTKPMRDEALRMGVWKSYAGREYPRVQILSIADLLLYQDGPRYPAQDKNSILGFKAERQQRAALQKSLF